MELDLKNYRLLMTRILLVGLAFSPIGTELITQINNDNNDLATLLRRSLIGHETRAADNQTRSELIPSLAALNWKREK